MSFLTKKRGKNRLLVIAGAVVTQNASGEFVTKNPMADYLHELSDTFGGCTWVANRYSGSDYGGQLDTGRVRVIIVERGWLGRIWSWACVAMLALQHEYVIYYLPNPYLPILPLIRACSRRLAVYLAGDYEVNIKWYRTQRWPGWAMLFRWSFEAPMRAADVVFARGRRLARMATRFNACVHETVPLGHISFSDTGLASLRVNDVEHCAARILFIGKIVQSKGVGDLLDAFGLLLNKHPEKKFYLDLVGEGDDRARYDATLEVRGLAGRVRFHGWVSSSEQINAFFSRADLLVVPSKAIYPEGVPRVIDEAIIRGVPVIATPAGGIGDEFCDDEILLVRESAPDDLAMAMERILFDPELRNHQLAQAASRAELFRLHGSAARQHAALLLGEK